jgi:hypothetical protein
MKNLKTCNVLCRNKIICVSIVVTRYEIPYHVIIFKELFAKQIMTDDETQVYGYNV